MLPFAYFDLGNVLVKFSVARMCRQLSAVCGADEDHVHAVLYDHHLEADYESGRIDRQAFFDRFCELTGTTAACDRLEMAAADIFSLNVEVVPLVAGLYRAGYRLGILSNTSPTHWEHCRRRFRMLDELFSVHALSYQIGVMKPHPDIYRRAVELAGVEPGQTFFVDDTAGHVEGAKAAGFEAMLFTGAADLARELRRRGLAFNG